METQKDQKKGDVADFLLPGPYFLGNEKPEKIVADSSPTTIHGAIHRQSSEQEVVVIGW